MKLTKSFLTEENKNIDTLKLNIIALSSKNFKEINIFVKQDGTFIEFKIKHNSQIKTKISDKDIEISGDNFMFEINPEIVINFEEDVDVAHIETNSLKIIFSK